MSGFSAGDRVVISSRVYKTYGARATVLQVDEDTARIRKDHNVEEVWILFDDETLGSEVWYYGRELRLLDAVERLAELA